MLRGDAYGFFQPAQNSVGVRNMKNPKQELGLSALLEQDISSYEYFNTLPEKLKNGLRVRDVGTFAEMQDYVAERRHTGRHTEMR